MQEKVSSRQAVREGGNAVILAHFLGNGVCHDDGDGVVGGGDVHGAYQQTHAQLTAFFARKTFRMKLSSASKPP